MQANEDRSNGFRQTLIHGKAQAGPIAGSPEPFQLLEDRIAGLLFPGPDPFNERVSPELRSMGAFFQELTLDHILSSDAGMVGSRKPEGITPLHAAPANQNILKRIV